MTERLTVLFAGRPEQREAWGAALRAEGARAGVPFDLVLDPEAVDPETVDLIMWNPEGPVRDLSPYRRLRAVLSMFAGVESIIHEPSLKVPLARMVEPGLTEGMTDYVVAHVARHHMGVDRHLALKPGEWPQDIPPLSRNRGVTVFGLGELGADAARALAAIRYDVAGWSRSPKKIEGVRCLHGEAGFRAALAHAEILVLLLPDTPATESILNREAIALMPRGAVVINPGRGPLIDDEALLEALDSGALSHATLDVFREEPLPEEHPFWAHPRVTITPHIASATRPETAAGALVAQIARVARGESPLHIVDRARGY